MNAMMSALFAEATQEQIRRRKAQRRLRPAPRRRRLGERLVRR